MSFAVGQRYISENESNLGLGVISAVEGRRVTIDFPAVQEQRIYSTNNAPLIPVIFKAGDIIHHCQGFQAQVLEVMEKNQLKFYLAKNLTTGAEEVIPEMDLASQLTFSQPQSRLFNGQIDRSDHFALRYHSFLQQQAQYQSPFRGLRGARASLIPHQLHIAKEVGSRLAPRVLLSDEVGLGKTIEAGLILHYQILTEKVHRALIIVPETLQHQWLVEMLRRFNLHFSLFDEERAQDFPEGNPFLTENLIICSLDWLMANPNRAEEALQGQFDMLVVDEAHHLCWEEGNPSAGYSLVADLAKVIPSVLLLTATPEQLGQTSHFARLQLLDPQRFYDFQAFQQEQVNYQQVAELIAPIFTENFPPQVQAKILELLPEEQEYISSQFAKLENLTGEEKGQLGQLILQKLIDRHGTSRLLFRNTRQNIAGFPKRVFMPQYLPLPKQYANAFNVLQMLGGKGDYFSPEQMFLKLNPNTPWCDFDPRVAWLMEFLQSNSGEKILVICSSSQIASHLEQALREKAGIYSALFHEKMSIVERDKAAAFFSEEKGARVLISSTIGSEGRNFQFASHLVLFDLPQQPDRLEQCIGRLDRIGQQRDVVIHLPCFENSPTAKLAQWYHLGLNAFLDPCPMGTEIFAEFGGELAPFLADNQPAESIGEGLDNLIQRTQTRKQELAELLEKGRDRLLEVHSSGGEEAVQLATAITQQDKNPDLSQFTQELFDKIGFEVEELDSGNCLIKPAQDMLISDFPAIKEDGLAITFDRSQALRREDLEFITWDHPLISNGIDFITTNDLGKSAVSLLINPNMPAGTLLLEMIYVVEAQAPKGLQITNFLPPTAIRLLIDATGKDLGDQVALTKLHSQLRPLQKSLAVNVVKMAQARIETMIANGEELIKPRVQSLIQQAHHQGEQALNNEIHRLQALQKVNKNIHPQEIAQLQEQKGQLIACLNQANYRLDSLHLIVSNQK